MAQGAAARVQPAHQGRRKSLHATPGAAAARSGAGAAGAGTGALADGASARREAAAAEAAAGGPVAGDPAGVEAAASEWLPIDSARIDAAGPSGTLGVFRSISLRRGTPAGRWSDIARAHQLCLKVLGLEDGAGSRFAGACVAYQIGQCKGACAGKEPLMLHDHAAATGAVVLENARPGRFPDASRIRESGRLRGVAAGLHARRRVCMSSIAGRILGTARSEEELAALLAATKRGCRRSTPVCTRCWRVTSRRTPSSIGSTCALPRAPRDPDPLKPADAEHHDEP